MFYSISFITVLATLTSLAIYSSWCPKSSLGLGILTTTIYTMGKKKFQKVAVFLLSINIEKMGKTNKKYG